MDTSQIIETTKQLIAIPSTADNPDALLAATDLLANIVHRQAGVTIERFERNGKPSFLAYRGATRPKTFDILLNAHVDVVPATAGLFTPVVKNGKLYGRGALDMKGTAAVLTGVFCDLVNTVPYNLGLQVVSDEEIGGYNGVRLQIDEGVRANFVIMGEYANDRHAIYNAARGLCWAEIRFKGVSAHGGHLWNGSNAVVKAGSFAAAILKRYPTPTKETWTTTASIANLSTPNDTYNKVPDSAVLKIDFRFTQEDPVFHTRESLEAFITGLDPEAELVNLATFEPAVNVEESNPYVQGLKQAVQKVTRHKPVFLGRPASSDGRHFALVHNDIVEFGLYGSNPHSDNEYVEIASFEEYRNVLETFLRSPQHTAPAAPTRPMAITDPLQTQLLSKLVSMPTVTADTHANSRALLFIEQFLQGRGMHIERFKHNGIESLYASTRPGNLRPTVLLAAHTDVVPASEQEFTLTKKGGKLYGRGVMDMKFAIASYLCLVDTLQDNLKAYDFGILITTDEEVGGRDGASAFLKERGLLSKVAIVPDSGENWQIETFAKGVQWIKLEAAGKASHASRPWEGESAIRNLLDALHDIEQLVPANPSPKDTLLSIGTIAGGTTANQIPTAATATLDIRYGTMQDFVTLYPRIQAVCKKYHVTNTLLVNDPPYVNDPADVYIKSFLDIVGQVTGDAPGTSFSYAATDGRYFSAVGTPCIIIEPPAGGRHTDDEWLSEKGFEQFCMIIEQYVTTTALERRSTPQ